MFVEAGIERANHAIYAVKPDGNCGGNSTALHCHQDESLGGYVRRNVNNHIVEFWPFFRPSFLFPHNQKAGTEDVPFNDEKEYLEFLRNDRRSALLWMDHPDLQAVANMYQISVHILTTNIRGKNETEARWTHLNPDARLKAFSKEQPKLLDMWLMHIDNTHFNLIVPKDSMLITEGSIAERSVGEKNDEPNKSMDDSPIELEVVVEPAVDNKDLKSKKSDGDNGICDEMENTGGPGYLGWKIPEDSERSKEETFQQRFEDFR